MDDNVERAPPMTEGRCDQLQLVQRAHSRVELAHLVAEKVDRFPVRE
jgi:hypothetical protein